MFIHNLYGVSSVKDIQGIKLQVYNSLFDFDEQDLQQEMKREVALDGLGQSKEKVSGY